MDSKFPDPCRLQPKDFYCTLGAGHQGDCSTVLSASLVRYNPYTGLPRHPREVNDDPLGIALIPSSVAQNMVRSHGPAEALYIEQASHLDCPACGGSGHVGDVEKPDPVLVACITLNGITLTVPVGELDSQLAEFQPGDTYDLTFKTMTRAELEALGEFGGF